MVLPPITLADRFQQAAVLLTFAGMILGVGVLVLRAVGKSSPARRRHGLFVLGWMVAGWIVGGAVGVYLLDNVRYYPNEADTGIAGFGLLLGWAVGMAHGGVVLGVWPQAALGSPTRERGSHAGGQG